MVFQPWHGARYLGTPHPPTSSSEALQPAGHHHHLPFWSLKQGTAVPSSRTPTHPPTYSYLLHLSTCSIERRASAPPVQVCTHRTAALRRRAPAAAPARQVDARHRLVKPARCWRQCTRQRHSHITRNVTPSQHFPTAVNGRSSRKIWPHETTYESSALQMPPCCSPGGGDAK
jgi:hypothetical protein